MEPVIATNVAIIVGLVQIAKGLEMPKRYAPVLALLLGLASSYVFDLGLLAGFVTGLSASGLWSGAKATLGK